MNTTTRTETKQEENLYQTVKVNGKDAVVLTGDFKEQKLAIVGTEILHYLVSLLPTDSFAVIRDEFIEKVRDATNLEQYKKVLYQEASFRAGLDSIKVYCYTDAAQQATKVSEPRHRSMSQAVVQENH